VLTQADQKVARARAAYVLPRGVSKARGLSVPQMRRVFPALLGLAVVLREREVLREVVREDAASRLGGPPVTTQIVTMKPMPVLRPGDPFVDPTTDSVEPWQGWVASGPDLQVIDALRKGPDAVEALRRQRAAL